jgi:hypothetical protein
MFFPNVIEGVKRNKQKPKDRIHPQRKASETR